MVRARSGASPAVVALVAVPVSACGAAAPQTSRKELFQEYVNPTHVKNDWSGGEGGASADLTANFASRGTPFERSVLVKRRNGSLELITLLLPDDVTLVPADITSVPGEGKVVAVLVLGTAIGARAARRRTAEVRP
ncbi:hypothetical protein QF037_000546 [Streptomyces canus]|uniref:hypothetical protein n=1 Tax=Streptomyces canus TaxID=58343 RepID=UPI00277D34E4|nr:hypothetical protein [Streptomyces canus]MDQ0596201.1 hypothetical protein [Streptomyces canus]